TVTDFERFELLFPVSRHPAVDLILREAVRQHDFACRDDFVAESAAQADLAPLRPALDALEQIGATDRSRTNDVPEGEVPQARRFHSPNPSRAFQNAPDADFVTTLAQRHS